MSIDCGCECHEDCDGFVSGRVFVDDVVEVVKEGHRRAEHLGTWEMCREPVCETLEEWVHAETRAQVSAPTPAQRLRMVCG